MRYDTSDMALLIHLIFRTKIPDEMIAQKVADDEASIENDWEEGWRWYGVAWLCLNHLEDKVFATYEMRG